MAAAYAALLSLINTIALERTSSPVHPPFPFDATLTDALLERVDFFVEFLEQGWKGDEYLEGRIRDLAYAAEDAIESPIVERVRAGLASSNSDQRLVLTCQDLETIIQEMDSIKAGMLETGIKDVHLGSPNRSIASTGAPQQEQNKMVGFEKEKIRIMEELEGVEYGRQVISIHGMGGSGKTTLARTVYDHQRIVEYFDIRAWVTVSQEYNVKEMFKQIMPCLKLDGNDELDDDDLGQAIHKSLCGRRYLVVIDDIWHIAAWDNIRRFFPDNSNGSRIILTTRLVNLANDTSTCSIGMKPLDEETSWKLLREKVFGQGSIPGQLEEVGRRIALNCRGLPLAVAVIGGLLAKSNPTIQYWNDVAEDFSSYLNDDDHCLKILSLSYNHLPIHLKPCFLYMGMFPEDYKIIVNELTCLWIAEGFVKPQGGKTFDEIAEKYLKDLAERNLIFIDSEYNTPESKRDCSSIHDLLREVCVKEAQRENFFCVVTNINPSVLCRQRRVVFQIKDKGMMESDIDSLHSILHVRSLIVRSSFPPSFVRFCGLLRMLFFTAKWYTLDDEWDISNLVNLRCHRYLPEVCISKFVTNPGLFRNMQMPEFGYPLPSGLDIWNWPHVRHLIINNDEDDYRFKLLSCPQEDCIILENLQTIDGVVVNFKFDDAVCKRIPNVKTLRLFYEKFPCEFMMHSLDQLQKLELLMVRFSKFDPEFCCPQHGHYHFLRDIVFPHSLNRLILWKTKCSSWEDATVIGLLPNLEFLLLGKNSFTGPEWNPKEGEFLHLRTLCIMSLRNLVYWNANCTHFPVLEQLRLKSLHNLTGVPLEVGEIPTLRLVMLEDCNDTLVNSVKNILEEQRSFGNETLTVDIDSSSYTSSRDSTDEDSNTEYENRDEDREEDNDEDNDAEDENGDEDSDEENNEEDEYSYEGSDEL